MRLLDFLMLRKIGLLQEETSQKGTNIMKNIARKNWKKEVRDLGFHPNAEERTISDPAIAQIFFNSWPQYDKALEIFPLFWFEEYIKKEGKEELPFVPCAHFDPGVNIS